MPVPNSITDLSTNPASNVAYLNGSIDTGSVLDDHQRQAYAFIRQLYDGGFASNAVTNSLGYAPANKAGDTFTGPVTVPTPTAGGHAVTKAYADGLVNNAAVLAALGFIPVNKGGDVVIGTLDIRCPIPAILDSTTSNNVKVTARDNGAFRGHWGASSTDSFAVYDESVAPLLQVKNTGGILFKPGSNNSNQYVGYRGLPLAAIVFADGECTVLYANYEINGSQGHVPGKLFVIYNETDSDVTIIQGPGVTLRKEGTTTTGNLTHLKRGKVYFWCRTATEILVSGAVA